MPKGLRQAGLEAERSGHGQTRGRHLARCLRQNIAHLIIIVKRDEFRRLMLQEDEADHILKRLRQRKDLESLLAEQRAVGGVLI